MDPGNLKANEKNSQSRQASSHPFETDEQQFRIQGSDIWWRDSPRQPKLNQIINTNRE